MENLIHHLDEAPQSAAASDDLVASFHLGNVGHTFTADEFDAVKKLISKVENLPEGGAAFVLSLPIARQELMTEDLAEAAAT